MEKRQTGSELIGNVLKRPAENFPNLTTTLSSPHSDMDIERMEKEAKNREKKAQAAALFDLTGVRALHRKPPESQLAAWNDCLSKLVKRIGTGMMVSLVGGRGTGKSQLAVELIRATCGNGKSAMYTTAMDIFIDLRDAYKLQESERAVLLRFQRPALLVIDEAQERGETPWEDRVLTALLDYRYSQRRDTVLVSNLSRNDFVSTMGASILSRMVETGGIIQCDWPSFRGAKT